MHAVELKAGPIVALFCVNNWSKFFLFENLVLAAEKKKIFQKETKENNDCVFFAETPVFIVFSAKLQNLMKHKKETKTSTICEQTCANCSCQKVRLFFCIFHFCFFAISQNLQRCFW